MGLDVFAMGSCGGALNGEKGITGAGLEVDIGCSGDLAGIAGLPVPPGEC